MSNTVDKTLRLDRTQLGQKRPSGRPPTILWAVIAGLCAFALTMIVLWPRNGGNAPAAAQEQPLRGVVIARQNIPPHTTLTADMLTVKRVPMGDAPQSSFQAPEDALNRVTVAEIQANQALTETTAIPQPAGPALAVDVPQYSRALTISLDPVASVGNFIKPGDHVDVLGTFPANNGQSVTRTVLEDVQVLAAGAQTLPTAPTASSNPLSTGSDNSASSSTMPKPTEVPHATVIVTPPQAQVLVMAAKEGKLQLALRHPGDRLKTNPPVLHSPAVTTVVPSAGKPQRVAQVNVESNTLKGLFAARTPAAPPLPVPAPPSNSAMKGLAPMHVPPQPITVIRGTQATPVTVTQ